MGFEIKNLAGLSAPLVRLIAEVSKGIGSLYKPRAIRTEGEAEAAKHIVIERAKVRAEIDAEGARLDARLSRIARITADDPDLMRRARERIVHQELEGQANVEAIAEAAYKALPATVPEEILSDDWRRRFFRYAEDVTAEDMQQIWGRILAGEIASPRSYSLKTLDVLRNLGSNEAELFRRLCRLAFDDGSVPIVSDVNQCFIEFGISYTAILALRDFGLLHEADTLRVQISNNQAPALYVGYNGALLEVTSPGGLASKSYPCLALTIAGRQLKALMPPEPDERWLKLVRRSFNSEGLVIRRGSLVEKDGATVQVFSDIPFPEVPAQPDRTAVAAP